MIANATSRLMGLGLAVLLVAGCGSDDPTDPGNGGGGGGGGGGGNPVQTTSVSVRDSNFNPSAIQVSPGATVTWTWAGAEPHNVIWVSGGLTNSPTQTAGTYQATMPAAPGELVYYCSIHGSPTSGMRGTVRIQ
jgi:plastocyanin